MRGDLTIRTVRTGFGATLVQAVQSKERQHSFLKHIGSAHTEHELQLLIRPELLESNFNVQYARRLLHRMLPKHPEYQAAIESTAIQTVRGDMQEKFSLVLQDVTTLDFKSFQKYDFRKPARCR